MTDKPNWWLNSASLADLGHLMDALDALENAGKILQDAGFEATFDVGPRYAFGLVIEAEISLYRGPVDADDGQDRPEVETVCRPGAVEHSQAVRATTFRHVVWPVPQVETVSIDDVNLVVLDQVVPAADPAPPVPEVIPAAVVETAAATPEPEKPAMSGCITGARWTKEDDAKALAIYAEQMHLGAKQDAAILVAAAAVNRPFLGTQYRFKMGLRDARDKINAEVLAAQKAQTGAQLAAALAPAPIPSVGHQAGVPTDLMVHLSTLPTPRGWQKTWDISLMQMACNGLPMAAIAADLGVDSGAVKGRFDALTGLHRDADDKPVRRFTRDQVLAKLEAAQT